MKKLLAILLCVLLAACVDRTTPEEPAADPKAPVSIISLAPHLTELLFSVGAGDQIAGVVAHSDFPPAAKMLPVVGDAFRIDPERLATLKPDLILAWQGGNPDDLIGQLRGRGFNVVSLPANNLDDVAANLIFIGRQTGHLAYALEQAEAFRQTVAELRLAYQSRMVVDVFYQISNQPLYTIGASHPVTELIELCGGRNIFADVAQAAPVVSLEEVILRDPQVIIASTGNPQLDNWSRWEDLRAVAANNLYLVDASLVNRSSLRILQGARQICAHLDRARQKIN
ncbi:MAG: cobalamin-binding protein [Gammaproteobacteria bacterium]|nr:cobalamin-binding protein [Gammaproteobacteria bacterium]